MKYRKDLNKMGAAMKKVRNPREWTPPGPSSGENFERTKPLPPVTPWPGTSKEAKAFNKKFYKGYGGIEMTGHPGEYLMGGGAIGGFKTAKTLVGKIMEYGSKYAIKSAKNSIKPTSIGSNSL